MLSDLIFCPKTFAMTFRLLQNVSRNYEIETPHEEPTSRLLSTVLGDTNLLEPEITVNQDQHLQDATHLLNARFASLSLLSVWFPRLDPTHPRAQTFRTWRSRREVVLFTCSTVATVVLLVNFIATVVFKYKLTGDILLYGNCGTASWLSSVSHVAVNILGTLLLGASNLCMQLLVSPTRQETDKTHGQSRRLDIGVPSIRNLKYIEGRRQLLF
jgi:hypothetical protein